MLMDMGVTQLLLVAVWKLWGYVKYLSGEYINANGKPLKRKKLKS